MMDQNFHPIHIVDEKRQIQRCHQIILMFFTINNPLIELSKAQNSPKLVESPKLNKKRKKEMPELKRLNVPTEYNSNENLQAIPSPIKTLQDVRYFSLTMKYDPLLGIINRRLKDSKIQDRSLQNYKLLKQNLLVIQLKYSGPSVQTPTIMAVTPSQLTNGQVRIFSYVTWTMFSNSQFRTLIFREFSILIPRWKRHQGHVRSLRWPVYNRQDRVT